MNILITGAWNFAEEELRQIKALGHSVMVLQQEKDNLPFKLDWVEGIVCNAFFLFHDISMFPNLKYIQTTSAGLEKIPLAYCKLHNIKVYNAKDVYSIPIAEYVVCSSLVFYKRFSKFVENQKKHIWEKERFVNELFNKNILIIGCGNIGIECAKRFKAFGCCVYGIDLVSKESDYFDVVYPFENMFNILHSADIVVVSVPLTKETTSMIDTAFFNKMKKTSIIINVSRGQVVVEGDLILALEEKRIAGAVLDVFENEPLDASSSLWNLDNVILTPHNSFVGENNSARLFRTIYKNLQEEE